MKSYWSYEWEAYCYDVPVKGIHIKNRKYDFGRVATAHDFRIKLIREPDNPVDPNAIKVMAVGTVSDTKKSVHIGYIPKELAREIDKDAIIDARPQFLSLPTPEYNFINLTLILLVKIPPQEKLAIELNAEISGLSKEAKTLEKEAPNMAIKKYTAAIEQIKRFDDECQGYHRHTRYPINRVSLLLEKGKNLQAALDAIIEYEAYHDPWGLTKADAESVRKRKIRLEKKLNKNRA